MYNLHLYLKKICCSSLLLIICVIGFSQSSQWINLEINPAIKTKASRYFYLKSESATYETDIEMEIKKNDTILVSNLKKPLAALIHVFHEWKEDTLLIFAFLGENGGPGFSIRVAGNMATAYHIESCPDDLDCAKLKPEDEFDFGIYVGCNHIKIILNKIPLKGSMERIIGYVSYQSENYLMKSKTKEYDIVNTQMKVYFRSDELLKK
jgi:hypothetical protein